MATTTTPGLPSPSLSPETKTKPQSDLASSPSRPPPQKPKRSLRILCFGDSLTSGYSQLGATTHPYSQRLTSVLSTSFPSLTIDAHTDGLPGDVVCTAGSRYLRRIEPKFLTKGGGTPYDWTVVLGGTNDLAFQFTAEDIYKALRDVWDVALSKGGRVLACTVPEAGVRGKIGERVKGRRDELNELILSHRQENLYVFPLVFLPLFCSFSDQLKPLTLTLFATPASRSTSTPRSPSGPSPRRSARPTGTTTST